MISQHDSSIREEEMNELLTELKKQLTARYPTPPTLRAFHPKMHGLVKAWFDIPQDLPSNLQSPLFVPGKSYEALVRFSNGSRIVSSDKKKDLRGIAIKIIGVPGIKVLEHEQHAVTQDILLANYPIFPPGTFHGTVKGIIATSGNIFKKLFFALTHLGVVIKALKSATHCENLLNETYFSQVPYHYNQDFVKFILKPTTQLESVTTKDPDNFLKERLIHNLTDHAAAFDLYIQSRTEGDPINDASAEWKGTLTKVASLRIIQQLFDKPSQNALGETLSFNPWHSVQEHIPAGDIGKARKEIYNVMSSFRQPDSITPEPTSFNI